MLENVVYYHTAPYRIKKVHSILEYTPKNAYACIRYLYCAICGSDYSFYCGRRTSYPLSLGHEFVGQIISLGKGCQGFEIGDYVISDFNYRCGKCKYCKSGMSHLCQQNNKQDFSNRGFAHYGHVHLSYLVKMSNLQKTWHGCLSEPLSCVMHASAVAGITPDMNILIFGGGGIGMLFCFYLTRVIQCANVDIKEKNIEKLSRIENRFNVNLNHKKAYDLVIDCTNEPDGTELALFNVNRGGKICIMSHLYGLDTSFIYEECCRREISPIFPLRNGEKKNLEDACRLVSKHWDLNDDLLLHHYSDVSLAFAMKNRDAGCKQIIQLDVMC